MSAPRLPRPRLLDALTWVASGRVPAGDGSRPASAADLAAFAADALAPRSPERCAWCGGRCCPACEPDRGRALHGRVLALIREEGPVSGRAVRARLGGAPQPIVRALHALEREGLVRREGSGRMTLWRAASPEEPGR